MPLTSVYLAEEALSLPPEQREQLAKLLIDSLKPDAPSDEELTAMLRSRWPSFGRARTVASRSKMSSVRKRERRFQYLFQTVASAR